MTLAPKCPMKIAARLATLATLLCAAFVVNAQAYPTKPIKLDRKSVV